MPNPIIPKHNDTAGVVPTSESLLANEFCINTADGAAFVKRPNGEVKRITDPTKVSKSGNESIDGIKTFNNSPIVPNATQNGQAVNLGQINTPNSTPIKTALNASGSAPIYACRAWVNFDGTGTVAIRASGNVSSITDNGTGSYTVNFTTAMPDMNYCVSGLSGAGSGAVIGGISFTQNTSTTSRGVMVFNSSTGNSVDASFVNLIIVR